ncbi:MULTISPECIES: hypothetical protein [Marichromatium]|uniref:hypothetical protein n=1 Tax=Marichromatium TaxID=85076 RepID=UPI001047D5D6|nr:MULTISPECIES: hypothetical protein [Marichromatium]
MKLAHKRCLALLAADWENHQLYPRDPVAFIRRVGGSGGEMVEPPRYRLARQSPIKHTSFADRRLDADSNRKAAKGAKKT